MNAPGTPIPQMPIQPRETLLSTPTLTCRLLDASERDHLIEASRLEIAAWGKVGQDAEHFFSRAKHGYVIGAFQDGKLVGTISTLRRYWKNVLDLTPEKIAAGNPYGSWYGIAANGTFADADPEGDALFCMAVTAVGAAQRPFPEVPAGDARALNIARCLATLKDLSAPECAKTVAKLAAAVVEDYVQQDPVIRFHKKPKLGILGGAHTIITCPNGRHDDYESLGYNVIMAYPDVDGTANVPDRVEVDASIGETLVVAAGRLGWRCAVRIVSPYSRPAAFRHNLIKALVSVGTGEVKDEPFTNAVRTALTAL